MAASSVIVIGAGIGGLAAAAVLAHRGVQVTLVERAEQVGGKLRQDVLLGRGVDAGPTVLTMRWALERVFASAGCELSKAVALTKLETLARHVYHDGSAVDLFSDVERSAAAIDDLAGPREANAYRRFAAYGEQIFEAVEGPFLDGPRPTVVSMLRHAGKLGPRGLYALDGHRTMQSAIDGFFADPRLRCLFGRFATYVGSSPLTAPATLNVIAHVERLGVWSIASGLQGLAQALATIAEQNGARIMLGAHVSEIEVRSGRARGVRMRDGQRYGADNIVFAGDVAALKSGLLGDGVRTSAPATKRHSYSAVTASVVGRVSGRDLARHNVFFAADARREFAELDRGELPVEPAVYIAAHDRLASQAPAGGLERLLLITNAPAGANALGTEAERRSWTEHLLLRLRRTYGLEIAPEAFTVTTPSMFAARFPGTGGAIYGPSATGMAASFSRASARSALPGLYLAGGSVHPGAGVPMAAQSGLLSARAILADLASTGRFSKTATLGGISMS